MRRSRLVGLALLIAAVGPGPGPAFGGDSPAEAALKSRGLTRAGRTFVDAEAEKPVLELFRAARSVFATYAQAAEKQAAAEQLQMQVAQLDEQRATLQANLNALTQQINAQNSSMGGGRYARAARSMTAPLQAEHQQVQAALNQTNATQKNVRSQIPSAKDRATIDDDVKKKGEAFKGTLADLRPKVDEVLKRYADLNADESVKKKLVDLEKAGHATMKIGPSEAFAAAVKELDQAERRFLGKKPAAHSKKKAEAKAEGKAKAKR